MDAKTNSDCVEDTIIALQARMPSLPCRELLICELLMQVNRQLGVLSDKTLQPYQLTRSGFWILHAIHGADAAEVNPTHLSVATQLRKSTVTQSCDSLVRSARITRIRSSRDRRCVIIGMTELGATVVHEASLKMSALLLDLFSAIPNADPPPLVEQLTRLQNTSTLLKPLSGKV